MEELNRVNLMGRASASGSYKKSFAGEFFLLALMLLWAGLLMLPGVALPVGNYWWDYFALKGLETQLFEGSTQIDQLWLPFILPVFLLKISSFAVGFGVDYLFAHVLIAGLTFLFSYRAVYKQLPVRIGFLFYFVLLLFSVWPVVLDEPMIRSFKDANAIVYSGFYNRYLDIIFCLLLVSLVTYRGGERKFFVMFWCYALVIALLSKISYFLVFMGVMTGFALAFRSSGMLVALIFGGGGAIALSLSLPNYFATVVDVAKVRGLVVDANIMIALAVSAVIGVAVYCLFSRSIRHLLIVPLPLVGGLLISKGNYGDLVTLRLVVAAAVSVVMLARLAGSFSISFSISHEKYPLGATLDWSALKKIAIGCGVGFLLYPLAVVIKAGGVTSYAMAAYYFNASDDFVEYPNIPGFFSHPLYVPKKFRSEIDEVRKNPFAFKGNRVYTAGFFTLYAQDMDRVLGLLKPYDTDKIAWYSFPGMVPQVLGVGAVPEGGRPWYLFGHEINSEIHPDFEQISSSSDMVVVDECNWGNGLQLLQSFHEHIFVKDEVVLRSGCFVMYSDKMVPTVAARGDAIKVDGANSGNSTN